MDFEYSPRVEQLRQRVREFIDDRVLPVVPQWRRDVAAGNPHPPCMEDLKALARSEGLWNLFLPALRDDEPGTRLTNLEYAPLAEIMGRVMWASEVFNCSAPDTGNMEILHLFATPAQREQLARAAARGRDPLVLRDDRARRRVLRRDQHPDLDPPRRRRVRR